MAEDLIRKILEVVTPDIYERFKRAIELKRWPNGVSLTGEQMDTCMQAIVAYEYQHFPMHQRTGYVPPKQEPCADEHSSQHQVEDEMPITWR